MTAAAALGIGRTTAYEMARTNRWPTPMLRLGNRIRVCTRRTYAEHIRLYLTPALGHLRLDQLAALDIEGMYAAIRELGNPGGQAVNAELQAMLAARERAPLPRPLTDARLRRVHTT